MTSVNLVARDNGFGLSRDVHLLADALREGGFQVHLSTLRRGKLRKWMRPMKLRARLLWQRLRGEGPHGRFDVNLLLEHVRLEDLPFARCNLLVPNPEWCLPRDVELLPRIDGVLVKTAHAEKIFRDLGCRTKRIGFTSADRLDSAVPRARAFFHLAGRSANKGTECVMALWRKHPEWPRLTIVQNPRAAKANAPAANIVHRVDYIDDAELRRLQNANRFHLCCSETEGFGHYIVEAMSVGAVVLTTDAPPMNELVVAERGVLIEYERVGRQHLAATYHVREDALERAVERVLAMDDARIDAIGAQARAWFERNDAGFADRLQQGLQIMLTPPPQSQHG